jgi:ABC-type glycerol-3-phosphate transport system permease component
VRPRARIGDGAVLLAAVATLVFLLYPAVVIFSGSLQTNETLFARNRFDLTWGNYRRIFDAGFGTYLSNSLVICLAATIVATVVSVMAAYVFSRRRFRLRRLLLTGVVAGQWFPWVVLVTPLFILFARSGLTNSYTGMILCYTAISIPFSVYLLLGYLETVPRELDEAALVDGCTPLGALWHVVLPVMLPGVVATATYAFLLCWTDYLLALALLTRPDMKTLPLGLYQFFGEDTTDWGAVMAGSAVATLPALLLFLPLQRWLVSGLTAGSVKQ